MGSWQVALSGFADAGPAVRTVIVTEAKVAADGRVKQLREAPVKRYKDRRE